MVQLIEISLLDADTRNANVCQKDVLEKLAKHIAKTGLYPPLITRPHPKNAGRFIIIDGHHRKQVLEQLGKTQVECVVWEVDDIQAQLQLATLNRLRGEDNPRKRAELLDSLCQHFVVDDLVSLIPETAGELQDLLSLLRLEEEELIESVRKQMEKEEAELPIILSFVLTPAQAAIVEPVLKACQPEGTEDPSLALVAVCQGQKGGENV